MPYKTFLNFAFKTTLNMKQINFLLCFIFKNFFTWWHAKQLWPKKNDANTCVFSISPFYRNKLACRQCADGRSCVPPFSIWILHSTKVYKWHKMTRAHHQGQHCTCFVLQKPVQEYQRGSLRRRWFCWWKLNADRIFMQRAQIKSSAHILLKSDDESN